MSVKRNFIYNSIITVSSYIFPLLTYPYVSRVLGVSNIGICNFVDSIINYFVLFSMLGISSVGIREIAKNKSDRHTLSKTFCSLLSLNFISTAIATVTLIACIYTIPTMYEYHELMFVGVCKLIFNLFLVEWLYVGLEDFQYITKRTILVKLLYIASIFVFIHKPSDYPWYYILTVSSVCINAVINIFHSRHFITFSIRDINVRPYVNTFVIMGIYLLVTNIYSSLTAAWLGFLTNTVEVGYYTTSTKLHMIILALFSAFSNVLLPRVSSLISENKKDEYWHKIDQAVEALLLFSFPVTILSCIYSSNLIHLLAGDGYEGAYLPFSIIAPLIMVIGYEQIVVLQILLANKQEKIMLRNSIIGSLVAIACNLLFVQKLGAVGSAMVWLMSELTILTISLNDVRRIYCYRFPLGLFQKYSIAYIPLVLVLYILHDSILLKDVFALIVAVAVTGIFTLVVQKYYLKNTILFDIINKFARIRQ